MFFWFNNTLYSSHQNFARGGGSGVVASAAGSMSVATPSSNSAAFATSSMAGPNRQPGVRGHGGARYSHSNDYLSAQKHLLQQQEENEYRRAQEQAKMLEQIKEEYHPLEPKNKLWVHQYCMKLDNLEEMDKYDLTGLAYERIKKAKMIKEGNASKGQPSPEVGQATSSHDEARQLLTGSSSSSTPQDSRREASSSNQPSTSTSSFARPGKVKSPELLRIEFQKACEDKDALEMYWTRVIKRIRAELSCNQDVQRDAEATLNRTPLLIDQMDGDAWLDFCITK
ncbi:hypothetical protein EV182_003907 [Spiromyces aspiralis]|uniref:Uncharacterized protein n=1 Tax=Spiromyces aspiralis TaxID=68401 RepID=A0ACC1HPS0_9FUNG|nr:hypothetical protein EV182_003907 [Spiromyces aspiralis]